MNCPFSSIACLQAGLDRDAPPRTLQKMSQKSDGFAWNFCELYLIEKTQNAFGEFRAANVSSFARPLMTVSRPIQTHGPGSGVHFWWAPRLPKARILSRANYGRHPRDQGSRRKNGSTLMLYAPHRKIIVALNSPRHLENDLSVHQNLWRKRKPSASRGDT